MEKSVILHLEGIVKQFAAAPLPAVNGVSFSLFKGELLGLLGPSGCGKTTLLRVLAGFEQPTVGKVELDGRRVTSPNVVPPERRNTGMVFQDYALFPHLNVANNIAFGLKRRYSQQQTKQRIAEVLALVGLSNLEQRYPHELSGGQQQRIALARALAPQPTLILLDEPLSNLDVQVRQRLRYEIRRILKATDTSAIFVTHDQEEALAIADRIAVMRQGKIEQLDRPEDIYGQPASRFVAEFVTQANFLPATRLGKLWHTEIGSWELPTLNSGCDRGELMLRQEDITLIPDETAKVVIEERQFLGREYRYCLTTPSGRKLYARNARDHQLSEGTRVQLAVAPRPFDYFASSPIDASLG